MTEAISDVAAGSLSSTAAEKVAQVIEESVKSRKKENTRERNHGGENTNEKKTGEKEKFLTEIFLGSKTGPEQTLAEQWGIPYQAIATGKWRRYLDFENILLNVRDLFRINLGVVQAFFAVRRFKPDVIFSKGGYVSVPVLIAGWLLRVPIVIHDSDAIPGMTTRLVARFATKICLGYKEAADHFKSGKIKAKIVVTGVPIREEMLKGTRAQGLKKSGLKGEKPIVLIMGGSLGAEKINVAVREALPELLKKVEILHITGRGKFVLDHNQGTGDNVILRLDPRFHEDGIQQAWSEVKCPIPHFLKILDPRVRGDDKNKPRNDKPNGLNKPDNEIGDRPNRAEEGVDKPGYRQIEYANEDLADFYAMSDLIVSRAGANSIAEIEALHKPCILIPLGGKVSHGDQAANAEIMEKQGKCRVIADEELNGDELNKNVTRSLSNGHGEEKMRGSVLRYASCVV